MAAVTFRISDEPRRALDDYARQQQRPVSETPRESVRRYLLVQRFRELRKTVLPFAEAQGFLTDEDIFEGVP